ncbi:hypothetical protein HYN86_15800 [Flavobacterium fluviale]|uniref:Uncharacterized protein n=1 Tax=Flavobacterium fluviale TaxID=2249356 RepID=A0A344LVN3_9FLAO|nr:hypothetical protein HYN86_15800 [Flavobacterium fluviale]
MSDQISIFILQSYIKILFQVFKFHVSGLKFNRRGRRGFRKGRKVIIKLCELFALVEIKLRKKT